MSDGRTILQLEIVDRGQYYPREIRMAFDDADQLKVYRILNMILASWNLHSFWPQEPTPLMTRTTLASQSEKVCDGDGT